MMVIRVQAQDNNANGYLVWIQLTSDILQVVLMKIVNVQEMVFIDKSIIHVVSHLYTWYHSYKMVVPQVILNFK